CDEGQSPQRTYHGRSSPHSWSVPIAGSMVLPNGVHLLLHSFVDQQERLPVQFPREFCWALLVEQGVTDSQRIALHFVDSQDGLPFQNAIRVGEVESFGPGRRVELEGCLREEEFLPNLLRPLRDLVALDHHLSFQLRDLLLGCLLAQEFLPDDLPAALERGQILPGRAVILLGFLLGKARSRNQHPRGDDQNATRSHAAPPETSVKRCPR